MSAQGPKKYYWEDFAPGTVREFGGLKLEKADIIRFARDWDPQPFHVDEEAARQSPYGGLIASGWQTCAAAMRMCCDAYLLDAASIGSPGVENVKWMKPVRPGDTLKVRLEVLEARPLKSKPGVGLVKNRWQLFNQHGEEVMQMEGYGMFLQRPRG
ncbi:MAG: MaoC family dehydratase [Myxococcales bacterium]